MLNANKTQGLPRRESTVKIAEIFACSPQAVRVWIQRGCPADISGHDFLLNASEVASWRQAVGLGGAVSAGRPPMAGTRELVAARTRKELLLCKRYALELDQLEGRIRDADSQLEKSHEIRRRVIEGLDMFLGRTPMLVGLDAVQIYTILKSDLDGIKATVLLDDEDATALAAPTVPDPLGKISGLLDDLAAMAEGLLDDAAPIWNRPDVVADAQRIRQELAAKGENGHGD